jgi:hypothetical protein
MGTMSRSGDRPSHEQLTACECGSQRARQQAVERFVGHGGGDYHLIGE